MKQNDPELLDSAVASPEQHVELDAHLAILRKIFGHNDFRSHQRDVLTALEAHKDCLAVLPTGSGKSLCFAIPTLLRPGLTLVISPLIALIRDQVERFKAVGIPCGSFDSLQSPEEKKDVWTAIENGSLKILFISPERLSIKEFRDRLKQHAKINLLAVDEAHCISQWGTQFRPEYRKIVQYLDDFPPVQKLALTATATSKVRRDIILGLRLADPELISTDPFRENLKIKILRLPKVEDQLTALLNAVQSTEGQGIVYVPTRRGVNEIAQMLSRVGESVRTYHAGLENNVRRQSQEDFLRGDVRIMVATNAFGMGIDKRNLRFVFHAGLPPNLESYVQEIGRAGRDGEPARCYLFYSGKDMHVQRFLIEKSYPDPAKLRQVLDRLDSFLPNQVSVNEREFLQRAAQFTHMERDDLYLILKSLFREGILVRKYAFTEFGEQVYIQRGEFVDSVEEFASSVDQRKKEQLAKLSVMGEFVANEAERDAIMHRYFEI